MSKRDRQTFAHTAPQYSIWSYTEIFIVLEGKRHVRVTVQSQCLDTYIWTIGLFQTQSVSKILEKLLSKIVLCLLTKSVVHEVQITNGAKL